MQLTDDFRHYYLLVGKKKLYSSIEVHLNPTPIKLQIEKFMEPTPIEIQHLSKAETHQHSK